LSRGSTHPTLSSPKEQARGLPSPFLWLPAAHSELLTLLSTRQPSGAAAGQATRAFKNLPHPSRAPFANTHIGFEGWQGVPVAVPILGILVLLKYISHAPARFVLHL